MAFRIEKLDDGLTFGCLVTGLQPADLEVEETRERLRERWVEDGLIIFRGSKVTPDYQVALSEVFAETIVHPVREIRHPELVGELRWHRAAVATFMANLELMDAQTMRLQQAIDRSVG